MVTRRCMICHKTNAVFLLPKSINEKMKWTECIVSVNPDAQFKASYGVCYLHFREDDFYNWISWSNRQKGELMSYVKQNSRNFSVCKNCQNHNKI